MHVTGSYDYLLHAVVADPAALDLFVRRLKREAGAGQTFTRLALRGIERTPRTPARAHLPLLPSGPGGVQRDDAARGVGEKPNPAPLVPGTASDLLTLGSHGPHPEDPDDARHPARHATRSTREPSATGSCRA